MGKSGEEYGINFYEMEQAEYMWYCQLCGAGMREKQA